MVAKSEVEQLVAEFNVELYAIRDALAARVGRGLRRTILTLGFLMVSTGTAVVLLTRLYS